MSIEGQLLVARRPGGADLAAFVQDKTFNSQPFKVIGNRQSCQAGTDDNDSFYIRLRFHPTTMTKTEYGRNAAR